ncbi:MAG: response regulator transcription factor [Sediminispirochaetaceae bacterium]
MGDKTKVLIVDDEPVNLDFFDVMLSKLGFEVETAEDGEEALERLETYTPNLIILDNVMPKLTGWQVTRLLKKDPLYKKFRDIPVIMFSAMDDVKDKVEGFELGVEDYITKPFNFSEVLARIRAVLRGREIYNKLLAKEKKLEIFERLHGSFSGFLEELRRPIEEIERLIQITSVEDKEKVSDFIGYVGEETRKVKESLESAAEDLAKMDPGSITDRYEDKVLKNLDERMKQHFTDQGGNEQDGNEQYVNKDSKIENVSREVEK